MGCPGDDPCNEKQFHSSVNGLDFGVEEGVGFAVFGGAEGGHFPAAEGEGNIGAGGGGVEFQHAGLGFGKKLIFQFRGMGEDGGDEAMADAIA